MFFKKKNLPTLPHPSAPVVYLSFLEPDFLKSHFRFPFPFFLATYSSPDSDLSSVSKTTMKLFPPINFTLLNPVDMFLFPYLTMLTIPSFLSSRFLSIITFFSSSILIVPLDTLLSFPHWLLFCDPSKMTEFSKVSSQVWVHFSMLTSITTCVWLTHNSKRTTHTSVHDFTLPSTWGFPSHQNSACPKLLSLSFFLSRLFLCLS